MDLAKYKSILNLESLYKFKTMLDSFSQDCICNICDDLMIDAYEGVCGCHYCYRCIESYCRDGKQYCPGKKKECSEAFLIMDTNVFRNPRMNHLITRLLLCCPNENCHLKIEISKMEEHLRVCCQQQIDCPYKITGCDTDKLTKEVMKTHLDNDVLKHTNSLIEVIQNLKNEVNELKDYVKKNDIKILSLIEDSRKKDVKIGEMATEITEQRKEIEFLKIINNAANTEAGILNEIEMRIVNGKSNLMGPYMTGGLEANQMKKDNGNILIRNELRGGIDMKEQEDRFSSSLVEVNTNLNELREWKESISANIKDIISWNYCKNRKKLRWSKLCANVDGDFLWTVDGYTNKIGGGIFSKSFYSNNYRLCLCLYIDSDDSVRVFCHLMKGDNDEIVQWPMKQAVTVSVINQDNMKSQRCETYKYDNYKGAKTVFDRPSTDVNNGIGPLVYNISNRSKTAVLANDSIVISCVVNGNSWLI